MSDMFWDAVPSTKLNSSQLIYHFLHERKRHRRAREKWISSVSYIFNHITEFNKYILPLYYSLCHAFFILRSVSMNYVPISEYLWSEFGNRMTCILSRVSRSAWIHPHSCLFDAFLKKGKIWLPPNGLCVNIPLLCSSADAVSYIISFCSVRQYFFYLFVGCEHTKKIDISPNKLWPEKNVSSFHF